MYSLEPLESLRPLEMVFPHHLHNLSSMIYRDKGLKYALEVDKRYRVILDGSHRYIFLLKEGYHLVPVHWVDYDDPNVRVGTHRAHRLIVNGPIGISKTEVLLRGVSGDLYPPRTTRHFFPFLREEIYVPLSDLKPGKQRKVSRFVAQVSVDEEIAHNLKYIRELDEEVTYVNQYLEENKKTKEYLLKQIEEMRSI